MKKTWICTFLAGCLLLSACAAPVGDAGTGLTATAMAEAIIASLASQTPTAPAATPTATPTITATPTPYVPFSASAAVANLNVRTNPGMLFPVLLMLQQGDSFTVLGRSPGNEWIKILMADGQEGWVFTQLVKADIHLDEIPVIEPENALLIKGKLVDEAGQPINGVQFAITQGAGSTMERTDATTNWNGEFFAYMPPGASGRWVVAYVAISCGSVVMDSQCNCKASPCGSPSPAEQIIELPASQIVIFTWK